MASICNQISSSSTSVLRWNHDVFLSFRGEDTRYKFTDHLYAALVNKSIRTFRDDKLKRGEEIAPELLKVIEESRLSIVIFSENYATSRWCLDELVKIMECRQKIRQIVVPIFYHVDPSDLRKQKGSFGKAFASYERDGRDSKEKIQRWRAALTDASNLSGWHLSEGYESRHIKEITENIFKRLNCKQFVVDSKLVGMDSRVKEIGFRLDLESNDVRIIGIYGIGGIGKTTISKVVYNQLFYEFEHASFLEDVSKISKNQGLFHLQNQLLCDILEVGENKYISTTGQGSNMIRNILQSKKVFIVLDDVDDSDQLESLVGNHDWLGKGSRVIVTTRNKHLLTVQRVDELYEVEKLNFEEGYELFNWHAFRQNLPKQDFIDLSYDAICYCQGLPLALKILGSLLIDKTRPQWQSELQKLKREPVEKIHNILKQSFHGLDHTQKDIFLDIACCFKGEDKDFLSRILDGCNFYVERGSKDLSDKCLITILYNRINMHDLVQQMGWQIVREKFPNEPSKWSRLWDSEDIERAFATSKVKTNL
ncbi:hypothetical protein PVL29_025059 [Vitis rotundifolia]|uniref:TIR domain-containing protein n=1 Tax=Vitis rotundifolia TaxID=103349 RepID=A0AA38YTP8_VITRO|nr:hypothetical protein PVL29_025059 [Vitis rotundifolia]